MEGVGNVTDPTVSFPGPSGIFKQSALTGDICVRIITSDVLTGIQREERIIAHRLVLAASSPYLRSLVEACTPVAPGLLPVVPTIEINLGALPNAVQAFKIILNFLYSGEFDLESVDPLQILQVSHLCQIVTAELRLTSILTQSLLRLQEEKANAQSSLLSLMHSGLPASVEIKWLLAMQMLKHQQPAQPLSVGQMPEQQLTTSIPTSSSVVNVVTAAKASPLNTLDCSPSREQCDSPDSVITLRSMTSGVAISSPRSVTIKDKAGEVIVPSNDKEGWCRNKKYIERVSNGFMCTVCRKVYGRYNSVSYHVTIYHRNPPIKCDENGCQFTTREARYIHFHKYYRHHIPLPESIDLGCRKCPFCRHVSKSPAMLEKHISRHVPDCTRDGRRYKCPKCATTAESQREIYDHVLRHQENTLQCDQCNYRGRTSTNLDQHKLFKHSKEMFKEKLECVECNFKCVSGDGLIYHYERMHRMNTTSEDELQENASNFASTSTNSHLNIGDCATNSTVTLCNRTIFDEAQEQDEPMCLVIRKSHS